MSGAFAAAQTGFSSQTYSAVLAPSSDNNRLLSADFNGDGRRDLFAYGSRNGTSSTPGNVFLNNGSGGFLAPVAITGTQILTAAKIGDMNGDGYPDIVGCSNSGSGSSQTFAVTVYLNNGNGTFRSFTTSGDGGQCSRLLVGDVDHTGHLAVVVAGHGGGTNNLDTFSNDGTGALTLQSFVSAPVDDSADGPGYTDCGIVDLTGGDYSTSEEPT